MITLFQYEISPFCDKVRRILHVKGVPHRIENIPLSQTLQRVRRVNPIGKLPCIEAEGRYIADSTDIAEYLEARYPDPPLYPKDPAARAQCQIVEDWADESLFFFEVYLRFAVKDNSPAAIKRLVAHDPPWMRGLAQLFVPRLMTRMLRSQGLGRKPRERVLLDLARLLSALSDLLGERQYLIGDALTMADIAACAQLACVQQTPEGEQLLRVRPAVLAWLDRVAVQTAPRTAST